MQGTDNMFGFVAHNMSGFRLHRGGANETDKSVIGGSDNEIRVGLFVLDGTTTQSGTLSGSVAEMEGSTKS